MFYNPSVIFLRKCHLPLGEGGEWALILCHRAIKNVMYFRGPRKACFLGKGGTMERTAFSRPSGNSGVELVTTLSHRNALGIQCNSCLRSKRFMKISFSIHAVRQFISLFFPKKFK